MAVVHAMNGPDFEREVLLVSFDDVDPRFRLKRIADLEEGFHLVKGWQRELGGWDPTRPKTELAHSLFRIVAGRLRWGGRKLRLFSAIGTRLDLMGVDCFFEYKRRMVTIDLTTNPKKTKSGADLILRSSHFVRNEHLYLGNLIADRLSLQR